MRARGTGTDPPASVERDAPPLGDQEQRGRAEAARTIGLVPAFDGLRGIFIIDAVIWHLDLFVPGVNTYVPGSFIGVNVFFVLSGFLITAILLREYDRHGRIRLTPFYQGRALRLFPALFAMVAVEFVWSMFRHYPLGYELRAVGSALSYVSNWGFSPFHFNFFEAATYDVGMVQLWSLAVEEQFYLFWPLILIGLLFIARRFKWVPITVVVVGLLAVVIHRIFAVEAMSALQFRSFGWNTFYKRTDFRADDLLWGVLLAFAWVRGWFPHRGLKLLGWLGVAVLVGTIFVAAQDDRWVYLWGLPVISVATMLVVLACLESGWRLNRVLEVRWLCALGMVSYGMYVWHVLCYQIVLNAVPHWKAGYQVIAGLGLLAVATVGSWYLVEKPFLRIKDRLRRRSAKSDRSPAAPPPVPAAVADPDPPAEVVEPDVARLFNVSEAVE